MHYYYLLVLYVEEPKTQTYTFERTWHRTPQEVICLQLLLQL